MKTQHIYSYILIHYTHFSGDLMVSWTMGRDVFHKYLVDCDWCINTFHWHWLSYCDSFFQHHFRHIDPTDHFKSRDPSAIFIRKHVPALRRFSNQYAYAPWDATGSAQKDAGCVIGIHYPKRFWVKFKGKSCTQDTKENNDDSVTTDNTDDPTTVTALLCV